MPDINEVPDVDKKSTLQVQGNDSKIGQMIFYNEGKNLDDNLIHWNDGESFASMGIGHFLWDSKSDNDQFPKFIKYLQNMGVKNIPKPFLNEVPWKTKTELDDQKQAKLITPLIDFLKRPDIMTYQVEFIRQNFTIDLFSISNLSKSNRVKVASRLNEITSQQFGWYLILDYANFKGVNSNTDNEYGVSWGLIDVLKQMDSGEFSEFSKSAKYVLKRRVDNAPSDKKTQEQKWLTGWNVRCDSYSNPNMLYKSIMSQKK
jgi:hypothetical protein